MKRKLILYVSILFLVIGLILSACRHKAVVQAAISDASVPDAALLSIASTRAQADRSYLADYAGHTFFIRYLDVGQADAALVECDGHYMLIDGGNVADSSLIYSVLKSVGVTQGNPYSASFCVLWKKDKERW